MKNNIDIILPIYNQESHIPLIYKEYATALEKEDIQFRLLFVINGSKDKSYNTAQKIALQDSRILAFELKESGWGRAVKFGIEQASAPLVCYTNSARTHIQDIIKTIKYAEIDDRTVVKANRIIREKFLRRLGSVLYNFENRYFFDTAIWDVNGTPKIFHKKRLDEIEIVSVDDLIDAEIMAKMHLNKLTILEVPVYDSKRISGKSTTNIRSAIKMYLGLIKLKKMIQDAS